jgi:hypothetical protein
MKKVLTFTQYFVNSPLQGREPYKLPRVACTVTRLKRNRERVAKAENTIAAES